jgi:hypothetical protein
MEALNHPLEGVHAGLLSSGFAAEAPAKRPAT